MTKPSGMPLYDCGYAKGYQQGRADALAEVIKCKDCFFSTPCRYDDELKDSECVCQLHGKYRRKDGYCSDAERIEDEH